MGLGSDSTEKQAARITFTRNLEPCYT